MHLRVSSVASEVGLPFRVSYWPHSLFLCKSYLSHSTVLGKPSLCSVSGFVWDFKHMVRSGWSARICLFLRAIPSMFFAAFPIKRVWTGIRYCLKLHSDIEKGSSTEFYNMLSSYYESDKFTNSILIDWMFQIILQWGSGKWRTFIITKVGYKTRLVTCLLSLFSN